jgi:5-methylcytosine-specific restriction endonuclease McrA
MKEKNSRCLVLNADYTPLSIISWKRAMVWSAQYSSSSMMSIEIIDFYKNDFIIGTNDKTYKIPAVIKTNRYFRFYNQKVNFSRKNLFIRDNYTCQYCCTQQDVRNLTYDHVIPKSVWDKKYGSPTCWTNIVTACTSCNRKKGNKTPQQANMKLKTAPFIPNKSYKFCHIYDYVNNPNTDHAVPEEWLIYLS